MLTKKTTRIMKAVVRVITKVKMTRKKKKEEVMRKSGLREKKLSKRKQKMLTKIK